MERMKHRDVSQLSVHDLLVVRRTRTDVFRGWQIRSSASLTTKLTVEGPVKLKEEYLEGVFEAPSLLGEAVPSQLKGVYDQLLDTYQNFPESVKQVVNDGLKVPLGMPPVVSFQPTCL